MLWISFSLLAVMPSQKVIVVGPFGIADAEQLVAAETGVPARGPVRVMTASVEAASAAPAPALNVRWSLIRSALHTLERSDRRGDHKSLNRW